MTALAPLLFAASALLPPESFVREADEKCAGTAKVARGDL